MIQLVVMKRQIHELIKYDTIGCDEAHKMYEQKSMIPLDIM